MPEPATGTAPVPGPDEWSLKEQRGGGPFTTRVAWEVPEGGTAVWASRAARKRARIELRDAEGAVLSVLRTELATARRLRRLNWIASVAFTIGGLLFALGAWLSQVGSAGGQGDRHRVPDRRRLLQHRRLRLAARSDQRSPPDQRRSPLGGALALVVV